MRTQRLYIRYLLGCCLTLGSFGRVVFAQEVSITAPKKFRPVGGVGLYLNQADATPTYNVTIEEKGEDKLRLTVPAPESTRGSHTFVTGLLFSDQGDVSFTPVTRVGNRTSGLPLCPEALPPQHQLVSQSGLLQSLVDLRSARIEVMREKFLIRLRQFDKERLAKLEKGLGLEEQQPLEEVANPYELVERLSRLLVAIKTYEVRRKRGKQ